MSAYQVTQSAELMENYIQADFLQPQDKFIALQTDLGASLLFSIGTDNVLYLTEELQAVTHGWTRLDMSSAQVKSDFPQGATCKTFAAAQAAAQQASAAEIHLAMVLNDGTNDHLYLSLGNPDSDLSWAAKPAWVACPFNAKDNTGNPIPAPSPFKIAGVFISEATDKEYIVVDIIGNPNDTPGLIRRFYIDVSTPSAPLWILHDLAIDIDAGNYDSCLGRNDHAFDVDGLYTVGSVDGSPQLVYTPLYNVFNPQIPPPVSRLLLPGGVAADVIAAVRKPNNSSDLYVVGGGSLYYFASSNQQDRAVGQLLFSNPILSAARDLFAYAADGQVTVWGLNGSDAVFYSTCDAAHVTDGGAWSRPVPILTGVDAISPFIDRQFSANTFFAHSGDSLMKLVKSPTTGIWCRRNITLPPLDIKAAATKISSYTTRIQVTGDTGQGVAGVTVTLTAASVTSVYINHLYYRVGPEPIEVVTDSLGSITIVEQAHTLTATRFTAIVDSQNLSINPMDAPFQRNAKLDSVDALKAAVITNRDGTTRPFIPAGTSDDDLKAVASSNKGLVKAYNNFSGAAPSRARAITMSMKPSAFVTASFGDGFLTDVGDLFSWLESGVEAVVSIVEDVAEGVWHFVAKIADAVYYAVLDAVEKIVGAVLWLYNEIKVIIEDIILFLEFLFGWQDILITHRVFKNILTQFAKAMVDDLGTVKTDLVNVFTELQTEINKWADIPNFNDTPSSTNTANPPLAGQYSAPSHLGVHHFQNNVGNGSSDYSPLSPAEAIFKDLIDLLAAEDNTIAAAIDAIKTDIIDQFSQLTVTEIIKRLLAILADTVLQTVENVLVAFIDVLIQLAIGMTDLLNATIDIPVLSWLYHLLTDDDLSILDLICLIAAIPATLIFKIGSSGSAPFPKGDEFTQGLLDASSFAEIKAQFLASPKPALAASRRPAALEAADPVLDQTKLKVFGITSGILALIGSVALVVVNTLQRPEGAATKTLTTVGAFANLAYVSPNIATWINVGSDPWYSQLNNAVTAISLVKGFAAIPAVGSTNKLVQGVFPAVETVINIIWNVPVIANIIVNKDDVVTTYKSLIPESIGNFAFNIGGMLELPIYLINDPKIKAAEVLVQNVSMVTYGVMMVVAGGIYEWTSNQEH